MTDEIPMYQGADFSQPLTYFADEAKTVPLVVTNPVMDVRSPDGSLLATFDTTGQSAGLITITAPGALVLTMPYAGTAAIPPGIYQLDVFADVGSSREVITPRGLIQLHVTARITVDIGP